MHLTRQEKEAVMEIARSLELSASGYLRDRGLQRHVGRRHDRILRTRLRQIAVDLHALRRRGQEGRLSSGALALVLDRVMEVLDGMTKDEGAPEEAHRK